MTRWTAPRLALALLWAWWTFVWEPGADLGMEFGEWLRSRHEAV